MKKNEEKEEEEEEEEEGESKQGGKGVMVTSMLESESPHIKSMSNGTMESNGTMNQELGAFGFSGSQKLGLSHCRSVAFMRIRRGTVL